MQSPRFEMLPPMTFEDWQDILSEVPLVSPETDFCLVSLNGIECLESLVKDEAYPFSESEKRVSEKRKFMELSARLSEVELCVKRLLISTKDTCFLCESQNCQKMVNTLRGKPICVNCCIEV